MKLETAQTLPNTGGKNCLVKHLQGGKMTLKSVVLAKCCECMGGYVDGRVDCHMPDCPPYHHMPYRDNPPPKNPAKKDPVWLKNRVRVSEQGPAPENVQNCTETGATAEPN